MQAQPGSSGWGTPVLCSRLTDPAGEHWNGKADSELVKGQRAAGQGQVTAPSTTLCPTPSPAKFGASFPNSGLVKGNQRKGDEALSIALLLFLRFTACQGTQRS